MLQSKNHKSFQKLNVGEFVFAFFIITRVIAIVLSYPCISDIDLYLDTFVKGWIIGLQPYSQFHFEYPPLTLIIIYLPGLILRSVDSSSYFLSFTCLMFFLDFCCLESCRFYCKNRLAMKEREINYMILIYSLLGLLMFKILYHRLDIIVALFFATSLFFFESKNSQLRPRFFINALLGFFYKIIPVFTMPCAIIFKAFTSSSNNKKIIKKIFLDSAIFVSFLVTIIFLLEIHTSSNFIRNMLFHEQRGIQIESSYGSILMFQNLLLHKISPITNGYGSWNIAGNSCYEFIAKNLGIAILLLFYSALFFTLLKKKNSGKKIKISEKNFLDVTLVTILLVLAFQRVLSTQFFIWLIPILAIWLAQNRSIKFLLIFGFLFLTTFFIFSIDYFALVNEEPILVTILFLRNFILVLTASFLAINFFKKLLQQ